MTRIWVSGEKIPEAGSQMRNLTRREGHALTGCGKIPRRRGSRLQPLKFGGSFFSHPAQPGRKSG